MGSADVYRPHQLVFIPVGCASNFGCMPFPSPLPRLFLGRLTCGQGLLHRLPQIKLQADMEVSHRERSRSPRRRSRSPRRSRRSYSPRSRSRSREDYRRNDRRSRSPMSGAAGTSGGYPGSGYGGRSGGPPTRSYEDRAFAKEQMMQAVRESSQQDRRVYVGNLSYDVKWHHLKDFMRQGELEAMDEFAADGTHFRSVMFEGRG
ncbi:hypothetical protein CIHG_05859 [Coccidioides immitis H538.4]|uniref:RRM domain-containing protein n=1 Tax=Coccidioides immitis H538.4 TaxID=396776 RepID=A0A0J8RU22_COCIT|nr:hypothetical protein CIHG_05859 [Coccidioides immitis H538.4]